MKNLKIKSKILALLSVIMLLATGSSAFMIFQMSEINNLSSVIADEWLIKVEKSLSINLAASNFRRAQYGIMLAKSPEEITKQRSRMEAAQEEITHESATLKDLLISEEGKQTYNKFQKDWADYQAESKKIRTLVDQGLVEDAVAVMQSSASHIYSEVNVSLDKLVELNKAGAKKASEEADAMYTTNKNIGIGLCIALVVFGFLILQILVKAVSKPIVGMTGFMEELAAGNLEKDVPDRDRKDEIGEMAKAVQVFKDNIIKARELEAAEVNERKVKEIRQDKTNAAIGKFEHAMSDIVKFVATASTELQASAQSLSASAEETSKQSGAVAAASQQAAANVQTVASASEELTASINEIAHQVSRSSTVAGQAVQDARKAGAKVAELVEAAQKIGDVTKMITDIAEQTNLLALNATIEAARAGDAGKGFAVVASEVKNLANESTKATEEISAKIAEIQAISRTSADAINMICQVIEEIDGISGTISAAIQEQTAATQEISRNVTEAYTGTSEVTRNIATVSDAANSTGASSHQVLSAADELARQSVILKEEFDDFLHSLAEAA